MGLDSSVGSFMYLSLFSQSFVHLWNRSLPNSAGLLRLRERRENPNMQVMACNMGPVAFRRWDMLSPQKQVCNVHEGDALPGKDMLEIRLV